MSKGAKKRLWFVTGEPEVGKTTVILKAMRLLQTEGYVVGGVISRETRKVGSREGFELVDLSSQRKDVLASMSQKNGPRMRKYRVNLRGLADLGAQALLHANQHSDVIVIDEVGPMELLSPEFRRAVKEVFASSKPVLGAVHIRFPHPLIIELKNAEEAVVVKITQDNRDRVPGELASEILAYLKGCTD